MYRNNAVSHGEEGKMVYLSLFLMNFSLAASENISSEVCVLPYECDVCLFG